MNATRLLQYLDYYLKPLVEGDGGVFSIAADPQEALEMLAGNAPKRWRLALVFDGYNQPNEPDDDAEVFADALLKLFIQLPASAANAPKSELHQTQGDGTPPMLDRIEAVRLWVSRLRLNVPGVDCRQFRFYGSGWEAETKSGKALNRTHFLDFRINLALDVAAEDVVITPS